MAGVYKWMTGGILLTALISTYLSNNMDLMMSIVMNRGLFYGLMILELVMVVGLSAGINRVSATTAGLIFGAYAALNGVTLSVIFLMYTATSIANVFFVTTFAFGGLSAFGYVTKKDLGPVGTFCGMALFGMIGFAILSMFFSSMWTEQTSYVYSFIGVLVFSGLTALMTPNALRQ